MKPLLSLVLVIYVQLLFSQAPPIQWQKSLGGTFKELHSEMQLTSDGGYILTAVTASDDWDVSGNHGNDDYWIVKLTSSGSIAWQKCLGGTSDDYPLSIIQTSDGGYITAGQSYSNDGNVSGNHGGGDFWVVKLTSSGSISWQKCLGGTSGENAYSIQQTSDGSYYVAGITSSNNGDVSGNHGGNDFWVVKLTSSGSITWQKCLGGSGTEIPFTMQATSDGGCIVAGHATSDDGDVTGYHGGGDFWVVKLNSSGSITWQKCLGGTAFESAKSILQTSDGGYIVSGYTYSNDGNVSGNHGGNDFWVVKLNSSGSITWQKCLGGTSNESNFGILQTYDGGYIAAGSASSNNGDVSGNHGGSDFWVVALTSSGSIIWQKCLGGSSFETANSVLQTSDDEYIVAGYGESSDGDATENNGEQDVWVVKLGCPALDVFSQITDPLCFGSSNGSIDLDPPSNGVPPYEYSWSNGASSKDIEGLIAGTYILTVTDALLCATTLSFIVDNPDPIMIDITSQDISCFGISDGSAEVDVSGGAQGYKYKWSSGQTSRLINNLVAGSYSVTVTDFNDCTETGSVIILEPLPLSPPANVFPISCYNQSDGAISIDTSVFIPPISILWSNGESTPLLNNLAEDDYSVTVTDGNGCQAIDTYHITSPDDLNAAILEVHNVISPDSSNGSIVISPSGGTPPYTFLWLSNGTIVSHYQNPENLDTGSYLLILVDAHGCSFVSNEVYIGNLTGTSDLADPVISIYPNPIFDMLTLTSDKNVEAYKVINIDGKIIRSEHIDAATWKVDLSGEAPGVYLLVIFSAGELQTIKFLKAN